MDDKKRKDDKNKQKQYLIFAILMLVVVILAAVIFFFTTNNEEERDEKELPYTELITEINAGNVEKIEMTVGSTTVKVKLNGEEEEKKSDIEETIEEQTSTAGLDDIDLFDDFGDFDE